MPAAPAYMEFEDWVLSSRGLLARIILPAYNQIAVRADIADIDYEVYNREDNSLVTSGSLDVNEVMFTAVQTWNRDDKGFTFMWTAPGELWQTPGVFRIVIKFTIISPHPTYPTLSNKSFKLVWQNTAKDPVA